MTMKKTISTEYASQLEALHQSQQAFGVGSVTKKHYKHVERLVDLNKVTSVLDYGCGKGHFLEHLKNKYGHLKVEGYDVANPEYSKLNVGQYDLVTCFDVLEHVEFNAMGAVLSEIYEKTSRWFICSIANYPAAKKLPDGRNAHITQLPFGFWFTTLSTYFRVDTFLRTSVGEGLFICKKLDEKMDWR